MTAGGLAAAADQLLTPAPGATTLAPGLRARAAAALLRLAMDETLEEFWRSVSPDMSRKGRTRMLCLEAYVTPSVAHQWYAVWSALSAACHHQAYELPPTPAEVRAWHQDVTELLRVLPSAVRWAAEPVDRVGTNHRKAGPSGAQAEERV